MEKENNKKKRSIINLFDIVLILIALGLAALFLLGRNSGSGTADEPALGTVTVRYTVEAADLEPVYAGAVQPGDPVVDRIKKYNVGTVESVRYQPTTRSVENYETETIDLVEVPGRITLYITITAEAVVTDGDILVDGGYAVKVGGAASMKTPGFTFQGNVVSVERIGA